MARSKRRAVRRIMGGVIEDKNPTSAGLRRHRVRTAIIAGNASSVVSMGRNLIRARFPAASATIDRIAILLCGPNTSKGENRRPLPSATEHPIQIHRSPNSQSLRSSLKRA